MYAYCEGTVITGDAFPASPMRGTAFRVCKNVLCDPVTVREYADISRSVQNPPNYPISQICTDGLVRQSPNRVPSALPALQSRSWYYPPHEVNRLLIKCAGHGKDL